MKKHHVNPDTGKVNTCTAEKQCQFAIDGIETPHFVNKNDAIKSAERMLALQYNNPLSSKAKGTPSIADLIDKDHLSKKYSLSNYTEKLDELDEKLKNAQQKLAYESKAFDEKDDNFYSSVPLINSDSKVIALQETVYFLKNNHTKLKNNYEAFVKTLSMNQDIEAELNIPSHIVCDDYSP